MKKLNLFTLSLLFFSFTNLWSTNLKESVAIIRHDNPTLDSLYNQLGLTLQNNGFITAGKTLRNYEKSFGSGFIYQANSGNTYVVTNQHVVSNVDAVSLQINVNGKNTTFTNCPVLYAHPNIDLALIQVPESISNKALKIYTSSIKDGQEVFSAGYPGIGDKPLWQLGKGVISNKEVNTGTFGNKDSLLVIQHTAQVDAGNSGGPLLTKQPNDSTYYVVGVNTWKVRLRENTNFSIRTTELEQVINWYENKQLPDSTTFDEATQEFINSLKEDYIAVAPYISMSYILSLSSDEIAYMLKNSRKEIYHAIRNIDPKTGLKLMVANELCNKINSNNGNILLENATIISPKQGKCELLINKKSLCFVLEQTANGWKVVQIINTKAKTKKKQSQLVNTESKAYGIDKSKYTNFVELGLSLPIADKQLCGLNIAYHFSYFTYGLVGLNMDINQYKVPNAYFPGHPYYDGESEKNAFGFGFNFDLGAQVPVALKQFRITPYALASAGTGKYPISHENSTVPFYIGTRCGSRFGYEFHNALQLYLALEYNYRHILNESNVGNDFPHHLFLKVGLEW